MYFIFKCIKDILRMTTPNIFFYFFFWIGVCDQKCLATTGLYNKISLPDIVPNFLFHSHYSWASLLCSCCSHYPLYWSLWQYLSGQVVVVISCQSPHLDLIVKSRVAVSFVFVSLVPGLVITYAYSKQKIKYFYI